MSERNIGDGRGAVRGLGLAVALALTGCSQTAGDGWGQSEVTVALPSDPGPMVPTEVADPNQPNLVNDLFTGLTRFQSARGIPVPAAASTIETTDQITWRVTLKKKWTFHDGSAMTARSFVDAWNYAAYEPNGAANHSWFAPIAGFDQLAGPAPATRELSGLTVIDDLRFTITLTAPNSQFPVLLATPAFAPLPGAFFAKPVEFALNPVGNGPFRFDSQAVDGPEGTLVLARFPEYAGTRAKVDRVILWGANPGDRGDTGAEGGPSADSDSAASTATAAEADIVLLPADREPPIAKEAERNGQEVTTQATAALQSLVFPVYDQRFANPDTRSAISAAIDRDYLISEQFPDSRVKATGWVSPVANGYRAGACAVGCGYNAQSARNDLANSGGFEGDLRIAHIDDQATADWVDTLCRSLTKVLDVACAGQPYPDAATFDRAIESRQMPGPFVVTSTMRYPAIIDFLQPEFATGAPGNLGGYTNGLFDAALAQAAATEAKTAGKAFQTTEKVLGGDLPSAPLWFTTASAVAKDDEVAATAFTPYSQIDLSALDVR